MTGFITNWKAVVGRASARQRCLARELCRDEARPTAHHSTPDVGAGLAREGSITGCGLTPQSTLGRHGRFTRRHSGFTLIEVLVALLVVAIAYTGVAQAISQFVDQRLMLVERHTSHRVAWNRLIEQYSISRGLNVEDREFGETEGFVTARSGRWQWQISEQEAAGDSLIRYQVDVYGDGKKPTDPASGSLVAFFTVPEGRR